MAYTVSANFKEKIKDETIPKSCLILFDDLFFSTDDFTDNGVVFEQFFNTSEDLTWGDCPSDTLSFSVVAKGNLGGYGFGKCKAYIGVQTASSAYAFGDINAHIEVGSNTYTASASGLYRNDSKINNGVYVSLVSDGTYVYAVGLSSSVKVTDASGTVASYTPNRFMAQKLRSGLSAVFASNTARVWDGENMLTYEYVPMGVYNVTKPRSTVGDVVTVQDAYDNMSLFDRDASEFIGSLTYPITLSGIYTALCDYIGVGYVSAEFPYSTNLFSASPFSDTSCSLRDILWWIAERARRVAHCDRTGQMALVEFGTVQETLRASDIGQDGYSLAEFVTKKVTGVLLKGTNGTSLSFGTLDTAYVISANPFITTITATDLNAYKAIPTYVPMELEVLECDPSLDVGDFVDVRPLVDEVVMLTNVYNEVYTNEQNEAYAVDAPTYTIPIMNRTVKFVSAIMATYVATGNEIREADLSNTEYNANVAANVAEAKVDETMTQAEIMDRLTNGGEEQGIYLQNGKIYVNAEYVQAGILSGREINNGNGTFRVTTDGVLTASSGTIGGITMQNGQLIIGNSHISDVSAAKLAENTVIPQSVVSSSGILEVAQLDAAIANLNVVNIAAGHGLYIYGSLLFPGGYLAGKAPDWLYVSSASDLVGKYVLVGS